MNYVIFAGYVTKWLLMASENRTHILNSAVEEILQYGFTGARVDRIADRAGLNKRMIYHYFDDKQGLCEQVLKQQLRIIGNADTNDSPVVRTVFNTYLEELPRNKNEANVDEEEPSQDELRKGDVRTAATICLSSILPLRAIGFDSIPTTLGKIRSLDEVSWTSFCCGLLDLIFLEQSGSDVMTSEIPKVDLNKPNSVGRIQQKRSVHAITRLSTI